MSHLKLQKLLYYVQALHLAYFDQEIIEDDFEAWLHGPVSRKIFNELKDQSILYAELKFVQLPNDLLPEDVLQKTLLPEQLELVNEVLDEYGILTAAKLEHLSHSEYPWQYARKGYGVGDKCTEIIPKDLMKDYYKQAIYGEEKQD